MVMHVAVLGLLAVSALVAFLIGRWIGRVDKHPGTRVASGHD